MRPGVYGGGEARRAHGRPAGAARRSRSGPRGAGSAHVGAVIVLAATLLWLCMAGGASALVTRGHVFAGTFEGLGEHALVNPSGLAVDESTGEIYAVDRSAPHEQVERFKPDGKGGYEFVSAFNVKSPEEIAVDNSSSAADPSRGDVYVVGAEEEGASPEEHNVLYKYSPAAGKVILKRTIFHASGEELELEEIYGVGVDAGGGLWVYWGEEGVISGFTDAETNHWLPASTKETRVEERFECRATPGFAVAPDAKAFYISHERETGLEECPEPETPQTLIAKVDGDGQFIGKGVDPENTTGVAVDDATGDVYADNVTSVAAFDASGSFSQRFGSGALVAGGATAVDSARGLVYVSEPASGKIAVFASEDAGAPEIDKVFAQALTPGSERLVAQIDARGADTHYYFQYGAASCIENPAACTDVPQAPGADAGSAFGDQTVEVEVQNLQPNTTYHYRVVAENEHGTVESADSAKTFFTTLPSGEGLLADHRAWELVSPPDKHGATVGAISREGALIQASADGSGISWTATAPISGDPEGNRRPEPLQVISTRDPVQGWSSKDVTTPHTKGEGYAPGAETEYRFFSPDLSLALVEPQIPTEPLEQPPLSPDATEKTMYRRDNATGVYQALVTQTSDTANTKFGGKLEFRGATPDLGHVVFGSEVPLLTGAGAGLYEWASGAPLEPASVLPGGGSTPASEPFLGDLNRDVRNAISKDGSRVFWTNGDGDEGPLYLRDTVTNETIQINAAQGRAEPSAEEREEGLDEVHFQMASADGSKVLFTDSWPLTEDSTLEPLAREETVVEGEGARNAGRPVDLFEFDVETGNLTDLTVDRHVGEYADVLGTIPGISDDGAMVYFVANGVLAPGAEPGDCPRAEPLLPHPEAECNLYVAEPDPGHPGQRETKLIARLSAEDAADWGGGHSPPGSLGGVTSQVSRNGRYVAFMSEQALTGYDNIDASPVAKGARDEEVFLYDAASDSLICASCNPAGNAPHGVFDTEQAGEGVGLTVDRPETWSGHWLAGSVPGWTLIGLNTPVAEHQSRYLSDAGRLIFNSADSLIPADQNGKEDVYEYEPGEVGSCRGPAGCITLISSGTSEHESAFLDASENGNDVFFLTSAKLLPQDVDGTADVYDARVCGTEETQACLPAEEPQPPACTGEGCRPPRSPQPSFAAPASSTFAGPGNTPKQGSAASRILVRSTPKPPTRAQKLAKALKRCRSRYKHARARRAKCERAARKTYKVKVLAKKPAASHHGGR